MRASRFFIALGTLAVIAMIITLVFIHAPISHEQYEPEPRDSQEPMAKELADCAGYATTGEFYNYIQEVSTAEVAVLFL